jgi:mRNA interferase RelE/StbE
MITHFSNSFGRDLKKIVNKTVKAEIKQIILSVESANSIIDIPKLKKLKSGKDGIFYRIRTGEYRIGITVINDLVTFHAVMQRKDFYKYFP